MKTFIVDLIGLTVVTDEGKDFGTREGYPPDRSQRCVCDRAGNDGKEYLFPSIKECILDVDLEEGKVTVHILDGLLDL